MISNKEHSESRNKSPIRQRISETSQSLFCTYATAKLDKSYLKPTFGINKTTKARNKQKRLHTKINARYLTTFLIQSVRTSKGLLRL